jgi:hypothetical protein
MDDQPATQSARNTHVQIDFQKPKDLPQGIKHLCTKNPDTWSGLFVNQTGTKTSN